MVATSSAHFSENDDWNYPETNARPELGTEVLVSLWDNILTHLLRVMNDP